MLSRQSKPGTVRRQGSDMAVLGCRPLGIVVGPLRYRLVRTPVRITCSLASLIAAGLTLISMTAPV
jgi:hypothetical protein